MSLEQLIEAFETEDVTERQFTDWLDTVKRDTISIDALVRTLQSFQGARLNFDPVRIFFDWCAEKRLSIELKELDTLNEACLTRYLEYFNTVLDTVETQSVKRSIMDRLHEWYLTDMNKFSITLQIAFRFAVEVGDWIRAVRFRGYVLCAFEHLTFEQLNRCVPCTKWMMMMNTSDRPRNWTLQLSQRAMSNSDGSVFAYLYEQAQSTQIIQLSQFEVGDTVNVHSLLKILPSNLGSETSRYRMVFGIRTKLKPFSILKLKLRLVTEMTFIGKFKDSKFKQALLLQSDTEVRSWKRYQSSKLISERIGKAEQVVAYLTIRLPSVLVTMVLQYLEGG